MPSFEREVVMAKENDIVLIYLEDQPLSFARIEEILPDSKRDWYHVRLLLLNIPLQEVTWILRDVYIDGEEFTMNGKRMRLEEVKAPRAAETSDAPPAEGHAAKAKVKIISFDKLTKT